MMKRNYMEITKRHQMMGNEAALAAELLGTGVTKLGEAEPYKKGRYLEAFFLISNGIERTSKIIIIADELISSGRYTNDKEMRSYGHNLEKLIDKVYEIQLRHEIKLNYNFEKNNIIISIIKNLTDFSINSRYYNLKEIGSGYKNIDPIERWWSEICKPIIEKHYPKRVSKSEYSQAQSLNDEIGHMIFVMGSDELGNSISNVGSLFSKGKRAKWIQRWSRMYVLQICRWLSDILWQLSYEGGYRHKYDALLGLDEFYAHFNNEDSYLRQRKIWSLYKP